MEKKGEILNQLAIISDLLEKINIETEYKSVVCSLTKKEFDKMYGVIVEKIKIEVPINGKKFSVKIGEIDFVFQYE
jgi:hypothetical protein